MRNSKIRKAKLVITQSDRPSIAESRIIARRRFLGQAAAFSGTVAVPWVIPSMGRGTTDKVEPSEQITVGLIGKGIMGSGHLRRLVGDRQVQVLAVCDVDRVRREAGRKLVNETYSQRSDKTYRGCAAYNDYRDLLAREDIDAVVIVTPDHWHSPIATDSAKAGKDIYCEKPISITVREGRELVDTVQRYGRIFQTGTQYRSIPTIREVCDFVRAGGLGKVKQVFTRWNALGGFFGAARFKPYRHLMDIENTGQSYAPLDITLPAESVPDGLDWDLWVGPALWRPYNPGYHLNPSPSVVPWAFCEAFGAASVTWHHSHSADVIQYALGVENSGPIEFIHPSSGEFPTLTYRYANGTLLHLVDNWNMVKNVYKAVPADARLAGNFGGIFVGEKGWVTSMTTGGRIEGGPDGIFEQMNLKTRQVNIGENNHHANFFDCIKTRRKPSCPEETGHRSASLGHLTIIAHTLKRSLKWDPQAERFIGDEAANRLLLRSKRSPWHV